MTRPFTVIEEMETENRQAIREDVEKAEQKVQEIVSELQQIQSQKSAGKALLLSPAEEQKGQELREQLVNLRRELREKEKGLRAKTDALYTKLTWMTVCISPMAVALTGLGVWIYRRRATRAA